MPDIARTEPCALAASSELDGHPATHAVDGNPKTTWRSLVSDPSPVLSVDWSAGGFDAALFYDGSEGRYHDRTVEANTPGGTPFVVADTIDDWMYVGGTETFGSVAMDIVSPQVGGGVSTRFEYFNGSWVELPNVEDGTISGSEDPIPFSRDGSITFPIRSDWATTIVNAIGPMYFIRWRATANCESAPTANQMSKAGALSRNFRGRSVLIRFVVDGQYALPRAISFEKALDASGWMAVACEPFSVGKETLIRFASTDEEFDRLRITFDGGPVAVSLLRAFAFESPLVRGADTVAVLERKIDAMPEPAAWRVGVELLAGEDTTLGAAQDGNLCRGVLPRVDSELDERFMARFSTDGDVDTYWVSAFSDWGSFVPADRAGGNGPWWSIDLGKEYRVFRVSASWIVLDINQQVVQTVWYNNLAQGLGVRLYRSADGETWELLKDTCASGGASLYFPCGGIYGGDIIGHDFTTYTRYLRIVLCEIPEIIRFWIPKPMYIGLREVWASAWKREVLDDGEAVLRLVDSRPIGGRIEVDRSEARVHDTSLTFINSDGLLSPDNPEGLLQGDSTGWPVQVWSAIEGTSGSLRDVGWGLLSHITESHDRCPLATLHLSDPRGALHDLPLHANGFYVWDRNEDGSWGLVSSISQTDAEGTPLTDPVMTEKPFVNPYMCMPQEWTIRFLDADGNFEVASSRTGVRKPGSTSELWLSGSSQCASEIIMPERTWLGGATPKEGDEITFRTTFSFGPGVDDDYVPAGTLIERVLTSPSGAGLPLTALAGTHSASGTYRSFASTFTDVDSRFPTARCAGAFTEPLTVLEAVAWIGQVVLASVFVRPDGKLDVSVLWPDEVGVSALPRLIGRRDIAEVRTLNVARQSAFRMNFDFDWKTGQFRRSVTIPQGVTPSRTETVDLPFIPGEGEGHVTAICGRAYGWYRTGIQELECVLLPHCDGVRLGEVFWLESTSPALAGEGGGVVAQVVDVACRPVADRSGTTVAVPDVRIAAVDRTFLISGYYVIDVDAVPSGGASKAIW